MAIKNIVTCDGCGIETNPPKNSSWARILILGPDGVNFVDALGDLCESCKIDFRRWLGDHREKAGKPRLQ